MVNVTLAIIAPVLAVLVIIAAIYFLVYFQYPDDKWVAWFPKIVVVSGIALSCYNVLMLPLEVANQADRFGVASADELMTMGQVTIAFFMASAIAAVSVIPFTMYYYEGMDESDEEGSDVTKQLFYAFKWTFAWLAIFFFANTLLYFFAGKADIPVSELKAPLLDGDPLSFALAKALTSNATFGLQNITAIQYCNRETCTTQDIIEEVKVSYMVYMVAIVSLMGWVFFSVFGGIGLSALPIDCFTDFKHRPRPIRLQEYTEKKKMVGEQAELLLRASAALSDEMKNSMRNKTSVRKTRQLRRTENEFKKDVLFLEAQYRRLEDAYKHGGGNPLVHFGKLLVGIVGSILSLMWFIHILVFVLPLASGYFPLDPFLNYFFESVFGVPIVGIVFYGMFAFWLLLCVIKGTVKFGVRFLFIPVHPIKLGETMMNSLVFNVGVILVTSLATAQFCTYAFSTYARYTASMSLFGTQMNYLRGLNYVYKVLVFALPIMTVLSTFYLCIKPYDYRKKPVI